MGVHAEARVAAVSEHRVLGSGIIGSAASTATSAFDTRASWVLQTGRAVIAPILKSTYERSDSLHSDIPDQSIFWRDHVVMWVKDYKRTLDHSRPEVDPFNYLLRVRQPVLMLNGRYDFFFPVRTAQEPFFRNHGAPAADRKYIVYEGGHDVPRTELIREGIAWLDKYVGPVR